MEPYTRDSISSLKYACWRKTFFNLDLRSIHIFGDKNQYNLNQTIRRCILYHTFSDMCSQVELTNRNRNNHNQDGKVSHSMCMSILGYQHTSLYDRRERILLDTHLLPSYLCLFRVGFCTAVFRNFRG